MRRLNPTVAFAIAGVLALLLIFYVFSGGSTENPDRLSDDEVVGTTEPQPEARCGSRETYDLVKRELFRRAAQLRSADRTEFDRLSSYSVIRMDSPRLTSHDEGTGTISCAGALSLELPPGIAVDGGRSTLTGDIGYALQPAADGSGDALRLGNADAIIAQLATIGTTGAETAAPAASQPRDAEPRSDSPTRAEPPPPPAPRPATRSSPAPRERTPAPPTPRAPPKTPEPSAKPTPAPPTATANPSFNCRYARTRGEIAVCNDAGLAGLDRQMASQFNRAMSQADPGQRALLRRTRGRFLSYRDSCGSEACMAGAYRDRMREISDIMAGRWNPGR